MSKVTVHKAKRNTEPSPFVLDLRKKRPVGLFRRLWLRAMNGYNFNKRGN